MSFNCNWCKKGEFQPVVTDFLSDKGRHVMVENAHCTEKRWEILLARSVIDS